GRTRSTPPATRAAATPSSTRTTGRAVPRSPLRIGVTELRRRPGTQREVDVRAPVADLAITTARVPEGAEVHVAGVLEAIDGAITFQGTLDVPWTGECRRCLDEVTGTADVEVRE